MKQFKNFKLKNFLINLSICLIYPVIKTLLSKGNKITILSDTMFLMSMVFIVAGIITSFVLHGDFDITTFIAKRSFNKDSNFTYDKYIKDKETERKGSFNYPLFIGIFCLIASYIIAIFY